MSTAARLAAASLLLVAVLSSGTERPAPKGEPADARTRDGLALAMRSMTVGAPRVAGRHLELAALHTAPARNVAAIAPMPASDTVTIDIVVAYTPAAARHYRDITRDLIRPAIEGGNHSFRLSGVGHIELRLVHTYRTDYVEQGGHFEHVWRFADKGDGDMEEIHALRDRHRADVAILIVDDASGCGQATRVGADADEAFAVVHHQCAADNFTLPHEIGHILGATHDQGHVEGRSWRDIMSYRDRCGGCPRLPVWSNPRILIDGRPAGTAAHDNARLIAEGAIRVAAFR